ALAGRARARAAARRVRRDPRRRVRAVAAVAAVLRRRRRQRARLRLSGSRAAQRRGGAGRRPLSSRRERRARAQNRRQLRRRAVLRRGQRRRFGLARPEARGRDRRALALAGRRRRHRSRASARRSGYGSAPALERGGRSMKRIAVRTLAVVGAALLAACGLVAWLALTESGLLTAWRLAAPLLPRALAVGAVDGRLAGPIVLRDVVYRDDAWSATISRVE